MENSKRNLAAAVAGAVVGAGAVIASVIALKDQKNQKKLKNLVSTAKDLVNGFQKDVSDQLGESKENIKKVVGKTITKAEKITKSAKKEVKNL